MATVILTQPLPRVSALSLQLTRAGHAVIECPFARLQADQKEAQRLVGTSWEQYERVLLVSPSAVQFLLEALGGHLPEGIRLGVVGPGSEQALRAGIEPPAHLDVVHPGEPPYDADALLALPAFQCVSGKRFLLLRGEQGRTDWITRLEGRGALIEERVLYASQPIEPAAMVGESLSEIARRARSAVFVVTSRDAALRLDRWINERGIGAWARAQRVLTVHPRIAATLSAQDWQRVACIEPGELSLRAALESG